MTTAAGKLDRRRGHGRQARPGRGAVRRGATVADTPGWRQWSGRSRLLFAGVVLAITLGVLIRDAVYLNQIDSLDVSIYRCYAQAFWQGGQVAHQADLHYCTPLWDGTPQRYHAFPNEYPAPALAIFSLPLLTPWWSYASAYVAWMALFLILVTGVLAWRGPPEAAIAFPLYSLLAGWAFTLQRYDLIVGLCILVTFILAQRGWLRAATVVLAIATLLKVFPIVLFPLLLIEGRGGEHGRWRLDLVALFVAICLTGMLPTLVLDPSAVWAPLRYELARPLQIESLPGSLLWLTSNAIGGPAAGSTGGASIAFSYNSLNVVGGAQAVWGALCVLGGIAGIVIAYWRAWRGRDSLARGMVLVLIVLLVAGKVFSPQYLLWVLPLVAVAEGIRLRWLLIAALVCAIMNSYYTVPLGKLPWTTEFVAAIVARNALLCGLAALYLLTPWRSRNTQLAEQSVVATALNGCAAVPITSGRRGA